MTSELDRRAVVAALLKEPGELLVVAGLGSATYDVGAVAERPLNFYLWGAMGGAAMVGLGLALAQPNRRVLVITGDGEMLMGLGALATIAAQKPRNLAIAVLDNASYGETGGQQSHTALGVDLAAVATGCGWTHVFRVTEAAELDTLRRRLREEPLFAVIPVSRSEPSRHLPPRDGAFLSSRFRAALGVA